MGTEIRRRSRVRSPPDRAPAPVPRRTRSSAACRRNSARRFGPSSITARSAEGAGALMGGFNPKQLQDMLSQARQHYDELQRKMQATVVEASSGGGSVTVKMNGQKQVLGVTIDPEIVKSGDLEMLQDLVAAAVNAAVQKVDQSMQSTVGGMLGGMGLPGVF